MSKVKQRIAASGAAPVVGDCVRCCVATIFGRDYDEVPHFVQQGIDTRTDWLVLVNDWLKAEGYDVRFAARFDRAAKPTDLPGLWRHFNWSETPPPHHGFWMAGVKSKLFEGSLHAVVMLEDEVYFDPSPSANDPDYRARPYEFCGGEVLYVPEPWRLPRAGTKTIEQAEERR